MKENLNKKPGFKIIHQGNIFQVVQWEGKPGVLFEVAIRAPGVRLIIETEKDGQKALLMTRELRRETSGLDYRLPGGKVFDSLEIYNNFINQGGDIVEAAKQAAIKEGNEEAGLVGGDFTPIGISKNGATVEWDLYYFLVKNPKLGQQKLEAHEQGNIQIAILSVNEIFKKLSNGEIQEGRSADMIWKWLLENKFINFTNI